MIDQVEQYDREELYSYEEAADVIGVVYSSFVDATRFGIFTIVKLPHDRRKYLLKSEVDPLAGTGKITAKSVRAKVRAVQRSAGVPDMTSSKEIISFFERKFSDLSKKVDDLSNHMGVRTGAH